MAEQEFVIVLTTWPADGEVKDVGRKLVLEQLAACVNVMPPMFSIYRWQGRVEEAPEHQLLIKTPRACLGALQSRLQELHPYEVPEFLVLGVSDGSEAYLRWIRESVGT